MSIPKSVMEALEDRMQAIERAMYCTDHEVTFAIYREGDPMPDADIVVHVVTPPPYTPWSPRKERTFPEWTMIEQGPYDGGVDADEVW